MIDEPAKIAKLFLFPFLLFVFCTQDVSDAWQRQEPTLLRVLRNSPLAMPLFGFPITVMTALYAS